MLRLEYKSLRRKKYYCFPKIQSEDNLFDFLLKIIIMSNIKVKKCESCGRYIPKSQLEIYKCEDGTETYYHKICLKLKFSKFKRRIIVFV